MASDTEPRPRPRPPRLKTTGARQRESRPRPSKPTGRRRAESAGVAAGRHLDSWRRLQTPSWSRAVGFQCWKQLEPWEVAGRLMYYFTILHKLVLPVRG